MKLRAVLVSAALAVLASLSAVVPAQADGITRFNITFRTGDIANAGTEDSVRLTIFGSEGKTPPMQFDRDFRRGETWTAPTQNHPSIGTVGWISLGKSGRHNDAWFSEFVQIHDEGTGRVYHCAVHEWFKQEGETKFYGCV